MKAIGFGDLMIHFAPFEYDRFMQTDTVRMTFSGAEANFAMAMGVWGEKSAYVTKLPDNLLAQKARSSLASCFVDTGKIAVGGPRIGAYYIEKGASVRPSSVVYDRLPSSFSESAVGDYDWDGIVEKGDWVFMTGITPALTDGTEKLTAAAMKKIKARGGRVAYDANFRSSLTTPERAGAFLKKVAPLIDLLIVNEEHARILLGISSGYGEEQTEKRLADVVKQLRDMLGIPEIAVTVRRTISASDTVVFAAFDDGREFAMSRRHSIHIVDRVGSGDAFSAGLIRCRMHGLDAETSVNFAAAANAIKSTINGDTCYTSVAEVEAVMNQQTRDVRR